MASNSNFNLEQFKINKKLPKIRVKSNNPQINTRLPKIKVKTDNVFLNSSDDTLFLFDND